MSLITPVEGAVEQTSGETLVWQTDVSGFTTTPASPTLVSVIKLSNGTAVTGTVMPSGSISALAAIVTLPPLTALTADEKYRIRYKFTDGSSNTFEAILDVHCSF